MTEQPSVIVWDLENVPDLGGFAAACRHQRPRETPIVTHL
jgi:hypothetical protein